MQLTRSIQWVLYQEVYLLSNFIIIFHPELTALRSVKVTWPSCHHAPVGLHCSNGSKSYDNFMPATCLRVQIRNSMPSRKKSPWKNVSHHGWQTKKYLVFWIVISTQKCFERRFALSALLIVFHCIIWLLIAFHFIALLIAFSK